MNTDHITQRIQQLTLERSTLEASHNALSLANQKANQDFQKKAVENQTRYAQMTGAIAELQKLVQPKGDNNHDDSIPTLNLSDRIAHVCAGEQPESR